MLRTIPGAVYSMCLACGHELHDGGEHAPDCPELSRKPSAVKVTRVDYDEATGIASITVEGDDNG